MGSLCLNRLFREPSRGRPLLSGFPGSELMKLQSGFIPLYPLVTLRIFSVGKGGCGSHTVINDLKAQHLQVGWKFDL